MQLQISLFSGFVNVSKLHKFNVFSLSGLKKLSSDNNDDLATEGDESVEPLSLRLLVPQSDTLLKNS